MDAAGNTGRRTPVLRRPTCVVTLAILPLVRQELAEDPPERVLFFRIERADLDSTRNEGVGRDGHLRLSSNLWQEIDGSLASLGAKCFWIGDERYEKRRRAIAVGLPTTGTSRAVQDQLRRRGFDVEAVRVTAIRVETEFGEKGWSFIEFLQVGGVYDLFEGADEKTSFVVHSASCRPETLLGRAKRFGGRIVADRIVLEVVSGEAGPDAVAIQSALSDVRDSRVVEAEKDGTRATVEMVMRACDELRLRKGATFRSNTIGKAVGAPLASALDRLRKAGLEVREVAGGP